MLYSTKSNRLRRMKAMLLSFLAMFCVLSVQAQSRYYVSPQGGGDGSSWDSAATLTDALAQAKAGDEIWMLGFSQITSQDQLYIAPEGGFVLPSGVKLYGGFEGTETSTGQRTNQGKPYQMSYRSVLSGDINRDDEIDPVNTIFPANTTRSDNAKHVLVMNAYRNSSDNLNDNSNPTVVDGVTIIGGHGAETADVGGGIYVKGNAGDESVPYSITSCYLLNNYAYKGGAIYVDAAVTDANNQSLINQCVVYNNVAGTVIGKENLGGGIYMAGAGNIVNTSVFNNENGGVVLSASAYLVNCVVNRNTGGGVDMVSGDVSDVHVYNSVVWGNSYVSADSSKQPQFDHSAYPEATGENGNVNLSTNNRGDENSPMFDAPSLKTSFDQEYNWRRSAYPTWSWKLLEGSCLIDQGNNDAYKSYSNNFNQDLGGDSRIVGTAVDICSYEYQAIPAARIRYVKTADNGGSDSHSGTSWDQAYASVQKAIDDLAAQPGVPGEVWIAGGKYEPTALINGSGTPASFRMHDGISVYGGFAGGEISKSERAKESGSMPWQFTNETILSGSTYNGDNKWNSTDNKWSLTSASTHVVWFAPLPDGESFKNITVLDGVTIQGGQAKTSEAANYEGDKGAGIYMLDVNAYLTNSIVKDNVAPSDGGGVYLKYGRVQGCLVYNNSSESRGGGIYVDNAGLVSRSMVTNNSAQNGGGVYLDNNGVQVDGQEHPEYLILSTCVISNNTSVKNGAVYCNKGGVILQSTITNNYTPTATDAASTSAAQTGGLYIDTYAQVFNSVLWNNYIKDQNVQLYAQNASAEKVSFYYSALSGMNNIIWNNTLQQELISLADANTSSEGMVAPDFSAGYPTEKGVNAGLSEVTYFWEPMEGSNLRARGMSLGQLPSSVLLAPELDIAGDLFAQKPAIGAFRIQATNIEPEKTDNSLVIYVDVEATNPSNNGSSWNMPYRSLNEAIAYMAGLSKDDVGNRTLEIRVAEGDIWPRYAYVNQDAKSATIEVLPMQSGSTLSIKGGYATGGSTRDPLTYRSQINGNHEGKTQSEGLYHCIVVDQNAKVEFDGFHVINGYAAGTANLKYGGGMLVRAGATVTVKNSIFENNTAFEGAAIDAREASLTLINCVVNNNTNETETEPVINCPNLTLTHVTVVNNKGAAPATMGSSSFAAGNTSNNTFNYASIGAEGYKNFANPTNKQGATLGFDTYLGGYSNFAPLTSSVEAGNLINKATDTSENLDQDIAGNERNLGGAPDLGAYEAELPRTGRVYYVKETGDDSNDGLSWDTPLKTIRQAVNLAAKGEVIDGEKPQVWVAAGTYAQDPLDDSNNCFDILEGVNVYGSFPKTGTPNMSERHPFSSKEVYYDPQYKPEDYETILRPLTTNKSVRRVLGQSDEYNPFDSNWAGKERYVYVGSGLGNYTYVDEPGYVESFDGAYVYSTNGGEYHEADPAVCDVLRVTEPGYYKVGKDDGPTHKYANSPDRTAYESRDWLGNTSGQKDFVQVGTGKGDYSLSEKSFWGSKWWQYTEKDGGDWTLFVDGTLYYEATLEYADYKELESGYYHVTEGYGNYIQLKPGWNYVGKGYGTHDYFTTSGYAKVEEGKGDYVKAEDNYFVLKTTWDGFTIRDGYIDSKEIQFLGDSGRRNGGAGVVLFTNVTLANSIIVNNTNNSSNYGGTIRGGGIYCDQGTLVNCYITGNTLGDSNESESYGGGCYMYRGTAYNCVISSNQTNGENTDGAGIFIENAEFFNNTIVNNSSNGTVRGNGGISIYNSGDSAKLVVYNCIIMQNHGLVGLQNRGNADVAVANAGTIECHNSILGSDVQNVSSDNYQIIYEDCSVEDKSIFVDFENNNFRLNGTAGLNTGDDTPNVNNKEIDLAVYTDMDFTSRIKDCAVDAGAYESDNEENLGYETSQDGNTYTYYVTENGAGVRSGASVDKAACAMKLQSVLTHAGQTALAHQDKNVVVKIATSSDGNFVYHANTLSDPDDPQSYTFVIPYGVTVLGGYKDTDTDWSDANRKPKENRTTLSAICNSSSLEQEVNGYHTVTFGAKPADWNGDDNKQTIIDGLYLIDGKATSLAGEGSSNTRGGGAIVPAWAHVRNCVVEQCEANQGGGLYLEAGATVSGTVLKNNTAEDGGAIYADNENANSASRAHVVSCTITDNTATSEGGGIYLEEGALMAINTVVWNNTAPSDKNISGIVSTQFPDAVWNQFLGESASSSETASFYPFNHSFVETYELPSDFENTTMETEDTYFANDDRILRTYSPLIKHGMEEIIQASLESSLGISSIDMQNINRSQGSGRVDAGAYAFEGGEMPTSQLVTRIFVSQAANVQVPQNEMDQYIGRSFYTSLTWLDDALAYIREVRNNGLATDDTHFEILVAGGVYTPSYQRSRDTNEAPSLDQRMNTFELPVGVSIYGGFSGQESYSSTASGQVDITSIPGVSGTLTCNGKIETILDARTYSDLNGNGIEEPWELEHQTILSGDVNVSSSVKNAYHVVYSDVTDGTGSVLLDGVTIKDGETWNVMSSTLNQDEIGRGGALYTNGVDYTLKGCRVMNNKAVRGGAIYSRDANLTIIGSVIAGNGTVENPQTSDGQDIRGGAVYLSGYSKNITLKAINTLWANNETTGKGGAIATSSDLGFAGSVSVSLMNNTIVRNKAAEASAVYAAAGDITNTVMWGGEGTGVVSTGLTVNNSASDVELSGNNNVKLNTSNMAIDGPRFVQPSTAAGMAANDVAAKWNPASISVLTDAGDGKLDYGITDMAQATGAYKDWATANMAEDATFYMGSIGYNRYMGPKPLKDQTTDLLKKIDIGLYEYQYKSDFLKMDEIYVDTQERGDGSGDSWDNATSDIRGAIVALSDPEGGSKVDKNIYIRGGEYPQSQLYVGDIAYQAVLNGSNETLNSLTIRGSYAENGQQDFSQPTVFLPMQNSAKPVQTMFYANTNGKKLTLEGITFQNAETVGLDADNSGTLNLKNVAFRQNGTGADIEGSGAALIANALFADGATGLYTTSGNNVTVVNATFANNTTAAVSGDPAVYNSVSWKNGENGSSGLTEGTDLYNVNLGEAENDDLLNGPNFVDPDNGNYMLRPSIKLLNAASTEKYNELLAAAAISTKEDALVTAETDKDLGNNARLTDNVLDVGAYEYDAPLQQIVYVKSNVAQTDGSGSSWQNPIKDLQSAIDLASVYANKNSGTNGYVFVHRDVNASGIRVNMPNVKVYGGMNDETGTDAQSLIDARSSVLANTMSTVSGLAVNGAGSVLDGFKVQGTVNVTNGVLSTSVIENATVGTDGIVYNSFVSGDLTGTGKAVNVTSPNTISVQNQENVVAQAPENGYVSDDIWKYQLKENDLGINNRNAVDVFRYMTMVGHERDLSGMPRVRDVVDAGCFESWTMTANTANKELTADAMPTSKHVVYVDKGVEISLAPNLYPEGTNFNVGFLLLKHGAGFRSNGNAVSLTNLAVERDLDEADNRWDLAYVPFEVTRTTVDGNEGLSGVSVKTYDGARRAEYDYQFSATDGAWEDVTDGLGGKGLLLQSADEADHTVRMYGNQYVELATEPSATVRLNKYNNMEPWSSASDNTSKRFTHLENMSWNMFGSPFLCAMNYGDMEYGRVIYKKSGDTFASENTAEVTEGSVAAGSAVLTQSATLRTQETFSVTKRTDEAQDGSNRGIRLRVALAPQGQSEQDALALTAVPTEEASSEFNMAADGVKMMTVGRAAQIYMERSGQQYSLLSALDLNGKVDVSVHAPEAGTYSIFIPEDSPVDEYETVVLKDKVTGRAVDLLEGAYSFPMSEPGTLSSRFTLSFNREMSEDGLNRITFRTLGNGQVRISGLESGDRITAYQENGVMVYRGNADSAVEKTISLPGKICLIQVQSAEGRETIKKLVIR